MKKLDKSDDDIERVKIKRSLTLSNKKNKTDLVRALSTNKNDRLKNMWIDRWKSLDMFGQKVEFTFKG